MTTIIEAIHIQTGKAVGAKGQDEEEVLMALDESASRAELTQKQLDGLYQSTELCARMTGLLGASEGHSHGWIVRCRHLQ